MKPRFASPSAVLTSFVLTLSAVSSTHAASDSWDGSTDSLWATATNWLTDVSPPGTGETATFNSAGNGNTTIDLGAGVTLGSLVFDTASGAPYTIGAGAVGSQTLTLGTTGNAITMNSTVANNQTINSNLALTVTRTVATPGTYYAVANGSLTNTLTIAGGISASTAGVKVLNPTGSGNTAISGAIASGTGNMSLFKTGTGTLTLTGGATFSGNGVTDGANFASSAVFREGTTILGAGTYNLSNTEPVIGGVATHGGAGTDATLQLNNGAILNNISWLSIGRGNGTGTVTSNLTLNGTSSVTTTNLSSGFNGGNAGNLPKGAITLNNNSTLTVTSTGAGTNANTAATFKIGESAGSDITLTVNDSAVVNRTAGSTAFGNQEQGALQIGREGKATVIMNGGTINVASTDLGRGVNNATAQNGTLTIKTGATYNNEGDFRTGFAGGASGQAALNLEGGTLNIGTSTARSLYVGCWDLSQSTLNIQSGNLNLSTNSSIRFNQSSGVGTKVINLNGGAITSFSDNKTTANGSGVLDMMQVSAASNNTFNLNGGTLTVRQVVSSANNGTRTFNFNGGTLKATGDSAAFFNLGTGRANVRNGAVIINTNGFNVTAAQALEHSDIGGDNATDGGLTKQGLGTLTLSGFSSYNGPTTVSAGTLNVTGDISTSALSLGAGTLSGSGTVGTVTVNNSAAVVSNMNASSLTASALTFTTTGTANLNVSESGTPLVVTNDLDIGAGFTVNVASGPTWNNNQTYDLISYGTLTGAPASITKGTVAGLGARQTATIGNSGSAITLTISGDTPVWTGAESNAWTTAIIGGSKNWELQNGGTPVDFLTNDQVQFDDSATGTTDVNISTANVQVASVVFDNWGVDNSGLDYTISSSGGFGIADGSSPANLVKNGDGNVTLKTINSYTGVTTINAGTLQLGDGVTDGDIATSSAIVANGKLVFNRSAGSFTYGNVISGFGTIDKNGAGTQILTGDSTLAGSITINAGTLQVGNGGSTGSLGTSSITNNASLVFNRSNAFTVSGAIDGTGSVTQAGTGAVTFSGANTYSGGTTISPGSTILVGANNALGTGTVTLSQGAVLGSNGGGALPNAIMAPAATTSTLNTTVGNLTLNGNLSGSGNLNRTAVGGALTLFLGGDNSGYTGTFTVENNGNAATRFSTTTAGSANAKWVMNNPTSGRVTVESADGGTTQFGSLTGTGFLSAQFAANTIEVGNLGLNETFAGVLNQVGAGILSVTKVGSGRWTVTGTNVYTGDTTVNGGVLVTDGSAIPDAGKVVINGGKVEVGFGTEVVGTLFFGGTQKAAGTWGATGSGADNIDDAHFVGLNGVLSVTTGPAAGFTTWADANAPGQTMDQDHDGDGVDNGIEYFMGLSGSAFTPNPAPVSGTVTWTMGAGYAGVYGTDYEIQTSSDLAIWTQVLEGSGDNTATVTAGTSVAYDMPTGGKSFVRLVVKN
jgi:fibronectin-binding autotransporter adhesin